MASLSSNVTGLQTGDVPSGDALNARFEDWRTSRQGIDNLINRKWLLPPFTGNTLIDHSYFIENPVGSKAPFSMQKTKKEIYIQLFLTKLV